MNITSIGAAPHATVTSDNNVSNQSQPNPRSSSEKVNNPHPSAYHLPNRISLDRDKALGLGSSRIGGSSNLSQSLVQQSASQFLRSENIIHPDQLKDMKLNEDYVVLAHICLKDTLLEKIKSDGLKSVNTLLTEGDSTLSEAQKEHAKMHTDKIKFTNDPSLIYFRPVTSKYGVVANRAVFIAVDPKSVFVFNQEHRSDYWKGTPEEHRASAMTIDEYYKKINEQPPGTFLNDEKKFIPENAAADFKRSMKRLLLGKR